MLPPPGKPRTFRIGVPALDLFPGDVWARLQADFWRRGTENRIGYSDPAGDPQLREMLAGYLRNSRGLVCDPDQIIITAGTQQALFMCAQLLLNPGDTAAMENPGYPRAASARRLDLLAWAEANQSYILEDDYDGEYRYSGTPLALLASLDRSGRVLHMGTFSKIAFPGLRLGYIVAPPA
ncbi:PLP-dependent aminotransferase family protein, partial [Herbaspirillum lusitanum]|uniref:aminotransferase-like domain-containing protein n=1 Tax=Herbaspirillum lusitanum TaxID=213312 RepID=UPI000377A5E8